MIRINLQRLKIWLIFAKCDRDNISALLKLMNWLRKGSTNLWTKFISIKIRNSFYFFVVCNMKITISGSLHFAEKILELEWALQAMGHEVFIPLDTHIFLTGTTNNRHEGSLEFAREGMFGHYDNVAKSDAVLIVNLEKKWVKWYIGGAVLVEMGIACYLRKKIFILNPLPHHDEVRYVQEINLMLPTIINNDLSLIK